MLLISKVPRALETKTKLFGLELADVLLIFLYLSISNFVFGQTKLKIPLVWGGSLIIVGILYFVKRNKPENYLQHLSEYYRNPDVLFAGAKDNEYQPYLNGE
ncbi:MAG: hypothetical protein AB7F43_01960 [Bacteriovoracia bacterium]